MGRAFACQNLQLLRKPGQKAGGLRRRQIAARAVARWNRAAPIFAAHRPTRFSWKKNRAASAKIQRRKAHAIRRGVGTVSPYISTSCGFQPGTIANLEMLMPRIWLRAYRPSIVAANRRFRFACLGGGLLAGVRLGGA